MDIAHSEMVEKQLDSLIERRSRNGDVDPDEIEPGYVESVRRFNARREQEMRTAWAFYHEGQAARHRAVLAELVARHEAAAAQLWESGAGAGASSAWS